MLLGLVTGFSQAKLFCAKQVFPAWQLSKIFPSDKTTPPETFLPLGIASTVELVISVVIIGVLAIGVSHR